jgi:hypothetical protein
MPESEKKKDLKAQLWGWVLFVICAVLFTLSGVRARDILAVAASIIFLLGCAIFMIPLVKAVVHDDQPE